MINTNIGSLLFLLLSSARESLDRMLTLFYHRFLGHKDKTNQVIERNVLSLLPSGQKDVLQLRPKHKCKTLGLFYKTLMLF